MSFKKHMLGADSKRQWTLKEIEGAATRLERIGPNDLLAICHTDIYVDFAMFRFEVQEVDSDEMYELVFDGAGIADALKEMRHTWFGSPGDEGYVYYLPLDSTIKALTILKEYFE